MLYSLMMWRILVYFMLNAPYLFLGLHPVALLQAVLRVVKHKWTWQQVLSLRLQTSNTAASAPFHHSLIVNLITLIPKRKLKIRSKFLKIIYWSQVFLLLFWSGSTVKFRVCQVHFIQLILYKWIEQTISANFAFCVAQLSKSSQ